MRSAFQLCLATAGKQVPSGPEWFHEVKHDGYRMLVIRENARVRLLSRNGSDWTKRYPWIAEAALKNRQRHFVIDGEVVIFGVDRISDFNALHSRKHDHEVQLYAFDVLAIGGDDLRDLPLHLRKTKLETLLAHRPDGITVAPFERGEMTGLTGAGDRSTGSRCYGAGRTARVCGTLGALSKDTKGAPHVATF